MRGGTVAGLLQCFGGTREQQQRRFAPVAFEHAIARWPKFTASAIR